MPTLEELVKATGLTTETVQALAALQFEPVRLDRPVRDGDSTERIERFMALTEEGTDSNTLDNNRTEELYSALNALPPRDARVIRLYFGLDDDEPRTLEQIGRMLGVTRERVRQLRDRALKTLREQHGDALRELAA
jgi:RNA polymerase primary sigma factor